MRLELIDGQGRKKKSGDGFCFWESGPTWFVGAQTDRRAGSTRLARTVVEEELTVEAAILCGGSGHDECAEFEVEDEVDSDVPFALCGSISACAGGRPGRHSGRSRGLGSAGPLVRVGREHRVELSPPPPQPQPHLTSPRSPPPRPCPSLYSPQPSVLSCNAPLLQPSSTMQSDLVLRVTVVPPNPGSSLLSAQYQHVEIAPQPPRKFLLPGVKPAHTLAEVWTHIENHYNRLYPAVGSS